MGLIRSVLRATKHPSFDPSRPETSLVNGWWAGDGQASAGVYVNEETALHYSPFFAGVRVISEDLASLPLITYERLARGKRRATDHPLYAVLHDQPNPYMSSVALRETLQGHAMTWRGGYANIVRNGAGDVVELWPLRPDRTKPEITRTGAGRMTLMYRYTDDVNGIYVMLHPDEVLHVHGLGGNGIEGYSLIGLARKSIGLGLAAEAYGASFFGNSAQPAGVLKHPGTLGDGASKRLREGWNEMHRGLDNAQRVAILEEGMDWETIGLPPEDAQFLQTRKFGVTDMARWLRLPPHKVGDLEHATYSNIEHQALDYVTSALRIWLVRWEQAILTRALTSAERGRFFAEHLVDALLRGDIKSRYEAYAIARNWGWASADDVREMENQNPLPDGRGEVYLVPLNMVAAKTPAEIKADQTKPAPKPAPGPPPPPAPEPEDDPEGDPRGYGWRGRGIAARQRIAEQYAALIAEADLKLAKFEQDRVTALADEHLADGASPAEFLAALEELYRGLVTERTMAAWLPIITEFAAAIAGDAAADVGHDEPIDLAAWVQQYVASHVGYRIASELGQLTAAASGADAAAAVLERLARWVSERPDRIARWQGNQLPNAAAREVWRAAGIRAVKWVTFGSDDCPFCDAMDGATTDIEQPFAAKGSELGLAEKLQISRDIHHPPLHPGCDCQIVPA
ncbi:phage portal protein [Nonomuraea sp. NBC_00507]|uniref:phage portal protein n=1 Tax=Nonomuraea sp. NBC_00507 TaxID=2976002 RepID=UPI002E197D66